MRWNNAKISSPSDERFVLVKGFLKHDYEEVQLNPHKYVRLTTICLANYTLNHKWQLKRIDSGEIEEDFIIIGWLDLNELLTED